MHDLNKKMVFFLVNLFLQEQKLFPIMSILRAELFAAALNATTGHIVYLSHSIFVTSTLQLVT